MKYPVMQNRARLHARFCPGKEPVPVCPGKEPVPAGNDAEPPPKKARTSSISMMYKQVVKAQLQQGQLAPVSFDVRTMVSRECLTYVAPRCSAFIALVH